MNQFKLDSSKLNRQNCVSESKSPTLGNVVNQRILKCLVIVGFFLVLLNLITLLTLEPKGYIIDIYLGIPNIFFYSLIVCFLFGAIVLILGNKTNRKLGILLLILTHLTILIVPYMMGYYSMGRADDMSYIGEYLHIANSGNIASWDIYPASLIFGAVMTIIPGLELNYVSFLIPIIFSFIFIIGLILFSRLFVSSRCLLDIVILSSFILYLGPYNFENTPNALFFAFIPLFIYVIFRYLRSPTIPNVVILLVMTLVIPFSHPFVFFFSVAFIAGLILLNPILNKLIEVDYHKLVRPLLIMSCVFLAWFIGSEVLINDFRTSYIAYTVRATQSVLNETVGKLSIANFNLTELIKLFLLYYGRYVIPIFLIILGLALVLYYKDRVSKDIKRKLQFLLAIYLISGVIEEDHSL